MWKDSIFNVKMNNEMLDAMYKQINSMLVAEYYHDIWQKYKDQYKGIECMYSHIDEFIGAEIQMEEYVNYWESYKHTLPLWSNINTNCYFKLKENI